MLLDVDASLALGVILLLRLAPAFLLARSFAMAACMFSMEQVAACVFSMCSESF
jgi:hypothetical protein